MRSRHATDVLYATCVFDVAVSDRLKKLKTVNCTSYNNTFISPKNKQNTKTAPANKQLKHFYVLFY